MSTFKQGTGSLVCNKVGHNSNPIQAVCMKQGCDDHIPCCIKCMMEDHLNHQNHDFVDILKIRKESNSRLHYLNQLNQITFSLCELFQQWKFEIEQMINQLKQALELPENPSLNELTNSVIMLREFNNEESQDKLVKVYKTQVDSIKQILDDLKSQTNYLIYTQFEEQKIIQQNPSQQNINLMKLKFNLTQQLQGHLQAVQYMAISKDDKYFASSESKSFKSSVILWDVKLSKIITQYSFQSSHISALQFSNDNSMLAVCCLYYNEMKKIQTQIL